MWTLHSVTEETKKVIFIGIALVVGLIIVGTVYSYLGKFFQRPPQPIPPAMGFGNLPPIPFPTQAQRTIHYTIDTVDGKIDIVNPSTGQPMQGFDRMYVYRVVQSKADLGSLQTASMKVASVGFIQPNGAPLSAQRISDVVYRWTKSAGLPKSIDMDISNFNFHLVSNYMTYQASINGDNAPTDDLAASTVQQFLTSLQLYPTDISSTPVTTDYVIQNGSMRLASPGEKVYAVRVNYFQLPLSGVQIVYPGNTNSTLSFLITGGDTGPEVADATFYHQIPDTTSGSSSTYPIKTPDQAYTDLVAGQGYITSTYTSNTNNVKIQSVNLGYYIGETAQQYIMPVYIFQGANNFAAYVSAIDDHVLTSH